MRTATRTQSEAHNAAAAKISMGFGEKMSMKPLPFTKAAKLETQNGIRKSRKVCQKSSFTLFEPEAVVLRYRANPMMTLRPRDVSHSRRLGSK